MTISPRRILVEKARNIALLGAIATILTMVGAYAYFVNQAVLNVVERENLDTKIAEITSKISTMESEYIKKIDEINKDLAYNMGYREPKVTKFVSRKTPAESFSLNEPE